MERGQYLATAVSGCVFCHSELDWQSPGFPVKSGTEGGGRNWADEGMPRITAPNITADPETGDGRWTGGMSSRKIYHIPREGLR